MQSSAWTVKKEAFQCCHMDGGWRCFCNFCNKLSIELTCKHFGAKELNQDVIVLWEIARLLTIKTTRCMYYEGNVRNRLFRQFQIFLIKRNKHRNALQIMTKSQKYQWYLESTIQVCFVLTQFLSLLYRKFNAHIELWNLRYTLFRICIADEKPGVSLFFTELNDVVKFVSIAQLCCNFTFYFIGRFLHNAIVCVSKYLCTNKSLSYLSTGVNFIANIWIFTSFYLCHLHAKEMLLSCSTWPLVLHNQSYLSIKYLQKNSIY